MIHGHLKTSKSEYVLNFGINIISDLHEMENIDITQLSGHIPFPVIRKIFLYGLKRYHKELQLEDVGDILDQWIKENENEYPMQELVVKMESAIAKGLNIKKPKETPTEKI